MKNAMSFPGHVRRAVAWVKASCYTTSIWPGLSFLVLGLLFVALAPWGFGYSRTPRLWTPESEIQTRFFGIAIVAFGLLTLLLRAIDVRTERRKSLTDGQVDTPVESWHGLRQEDGSRHRR